MRGSEKEDICLAKDGRERLSLCPKARIVYPFSTLEDGMLCTSHIYFEIRDTMYCTRLCEVVWLDVDCIVTARSLFILFTKNTCFRLWFKSYV